MQIREFEAGDEDAVVKVWGRCNLLRSWNDPRKEEGSADYATLTTPLSDRNHVVAAVTPFSTFVAAVAQPSAQTIADAASPMGVAASADAASGSPLDPLCASGGLAGANPPYLNCQNTQVCPSGM